MKVYTFYSRVRKFRKTKQQFVRSSVGVQLLEIKSFLDDKIAWTGLEVAPHKEMCEERNISNINEDKNEMCQNEGQGSHYGYDLIS